MRTSDYWIKREQAWQAQQIKDDTKRMKQIMDKLFEAQEAIQKKSMPTGRTLRMVKEFLLVKP